MNRHPLALAIAVSSWLPYLFAPPLARAADSPAKPDATASSALEALHLPEVTTTRLDNGLEVVLEENHGAPFVAMKIRYDAGSRDDPAGKEGLAAITRRTMRSGAKHVRAGEYEATLDRIGAFDHDGATGLDAISEWVTVPSNAVDSVLWLWSDEMGFFAPDAKGLAGALAAKEREREEKVTRVALGALGEIVEGALYPIDHPYHRAPRAEASDDITLDDVRAFHDENVAPNDAVLVLVGDFQSAALLEKIRTYFGPIAPAPSRAAKLAPAQLEGEIRLDVAANVNAATVCIDWRTPPFFDSGDAELDLAARSLAGARVAVLGWELIDKKQVATRVFAQQMSHARGSDFRIAVTVAPGHDPEEVIAQIDRILGMARTRGVNDEAFVGARASMVVPYLQGLDRAGRRASAYAELAMAHRDPRHILGDVGRYDAVTNASMRGTIEHWLPKGHRVITVVTPDPNAPLCGILRATRGAK
jgi:zinc protease